MSSWMKSGFSEATTIESSLGDPEARGLWIRGLVRRCRRGTTDFQYLVPMPRTIRDAARSKIKVPAPTVVIMALMVNYRRKYSTNGRSSVERLVVRRARTSIPSSAMDVTRDITRGQVIIHSENEDHNLIIPSFRHVSCEDCALRHPPSGGTSFAHTAQECVV